MLSQGVLVANACAADGSTAASRASVAPDASTEPLIPLPVLGELLAQFAMPPRMSMGRLRPMNILDPLQELNNLGRSVSKASHQRIVFVMKHCTGIIDRVVKAVVRHSIIHFSLPATSDSVVMARTPMRSPQSA